MTAETARILSDEPVARTGGQRQRQQKRESAAHEIRQWVRLTSYCNNRCVFCLDTAAHNGTYRSLFEIEKEIVEGRVAGATRLILSGGEPTIHPNFVELIRFGSRLGYARVQTVTNGRLFAYPDFLRHCLDAGLGEITFSVHGHRAELHDALVGVPGAFDQEVRGIEAALTDGRPIVNIDVCLNRENVRHLGALVDRFVALGVREFDLLHIIPFGRAYDNGRASLFYDLEEAMPAIREVLKRSEDPGLQIWFNRFPPPYLEDYEHLIQDPHKLHDEVRGRQDELARLLGTGKPLSCREPARCGRCHLKSFCEYLADEMEGLHTGRFRLLRIDARDPPVRADTVPASVDTLWVRAPDLPTARNLWQRYDLNRLVLDLEGYDGFEPECLGDRSLQRAYVSRSADLDAWLGFDGFDLAVYLSAAIAPRLLSLTAPECSRLTLVGRNHERMSEAKAYDPDFRRFFCQLAATPRVEGLPPCLSGGTAPQRAASVIDGMQLNDRGGLDIHGCARRFCQDYQRTKSRRCRACRYDERCPGCHINTIRAHGYRILEPVPAAITGTNSSQPKRFK